MPTSPDIALARSLPELRTAELQLRELAAKEHISYAISDFGGLRTQSDTTTILRYRDLEYPAYVRQMQAKGKTPLPKDKWRRIAPYGSSYHNYGAAFDVALTSVPQGMTYDQALTHLAILGMSVGLRNGAAFDDPAHFELAIPLDDAKTRWQRFVSGETTPPPSVASILSGSIPGVQVMTAKVQPIVKPVAATIRKTVAVARRHPLATATISTGALLTAGLLLYVVVRRFMND